ncbi:MAG TPA: efflux RND transporter periplasmic adaptor subunit, partial [Thermodesulfobacteriota bacterium]|nr:efflux RND transporter periplasmic adaptor subunit [Thermodesulfobacteriota bacterium]
AVSKKDLDDAIGAEQATHAAVLAAEAAVQKAQIDLGFTEIVSPIDGVAGLAKAQIGDLVGTSQDGELTTVSTIDPIKVYFSISEQEYLGLMRETAEEKEVRSKRSKNLELILADGSVYARKGAFAFADRHVDVRTGTITVAAFFPNPEQILRPGQFAKIRAVTKQKEGALLVPQRAVTELQGSYQVAVVSPDNKVTIRPVKIGARVDSLWVVDEGLKPGDQVVAEGTQKVREGMLVTTRPFDVQPETSQGPATQAETRPKPASHEEK